MARTSSYRGNHQRPSTRHARGSSSSSLRDPDARAHRSLSSSHAQTRGSHTRNDTSFSRSASSVLPKSDNSKGSLLLSRRGFLYGAIGVGALAAIGGGTYAVNALKDDGSDEIAPLHVSKQAILTQSDYEILDDFENEVTLVNTIDVPYGTLLWVNDKTFAVCLLPTESGSPLAQIGFLNLESGYLETVVEKPVSKTDEYEIYDVRGTSNGIIWTEANIMQGSWRIYSSKRTNGVFEKPVLIDEGDRTYETPTLAAVGAWGFWQKIPRDSKDLETPSTVNKTAFGSSNGECLLESKRQNATPLYADSESIVVAPRFDSTTVYYELMRINANDGEVTDTLLLPRSVKPLEAGYGKTGFMFSFPDIYNNDEGVSNLGTYVPATLPPHGDYNDCEWFSFARTPTAPPAWAGDLLVVKSTYSICGIDLANHTYFAIDVENGADSFGEYLASTGTQDSFVTFTNVDHTPVGGERTHVCRVKVWKPTS